MSSIITEKLINSLPFDTYFNEIVNKSTTYEHDYNEFYDKCGKQHYRLLSYLSTFYNDSIIIDIGTHRGQSALALSYNPLNTVYTFDIEKRVYNNQISERSNINFQYDDLFKEEGQQKWKETILKSAFIFLDVDPHNGKMEIELYNYLKSIDYKGYIVCDDIWHFKEMRDEFWYKINDEVRYDLTLVGHFSGTGVITMSPDSRFHSLHGPKSDLSNWTLVTGYFNLTKCPDASREIIERDQNYYMSHSISTLNLPYNMIIYCDQDSYPLINKIRSENEWLIKRTHYIIGEFDKLRFNKGGQLSNETFADYRNQIIQNRQTHPYNFDPRNTASYYLFCMSRYTMLKEAIKTNPFGSTHFAWINFCIERMGYLNLVHLEEALSVNRDKFSTCYIDYIEPELVFNLPHYFTYGRCSMCSGFFTGNQYYMNMFCELMENRFLKYLNMGYGHADETLFSSIYFENAELFEHYYGDYHQMITNYKYIYDKPEAPVYNFIRNSFNKGNYIKCFEACIILHNSIQLNKCNFGDDYKSNLRYYMDECHKFICAKNN
jgi:hypothetical protein